jgi:hypothetical protein
VIALFIDTEILSGKDIIIFGTSNAGRQVLDDLGAINRKPIFCLDNNSELWDKSLEGIDIYSPIILTEMKDKNFLIIISSMYYNEIKVQLCSLGLEEEEHFIFYKDIYKYPLQRKFDRICEKYELVYQDEGNPIIKHIKETVRQIPDGEKVAIWGVGEHTENLLHVISDIIQVAFIIDPDLCSNGSELKGHEVKSPVVLDYAGVKTVIISMFEERRTAKQNLSEKYPYITFIDFYELYDDKIVCSRPFYRWDHKQYQIFIELHLLKGKIKVEQDAKCLQTVYKRIIALLLYIKDFEELSHFVQEYVDKELPHYKSLLKMNREIDIIYEECKGIIQQRSYRDIVLYVFDSMRYKDLSSAPYMNTILPNSLEFQNAFSASTYTRASYLGMFSKQEHDGNNLAMKTIDGSQSNLFTWLTANEYAIYQYGERPIDNVFLLENVKLPNQDTVWYPFTAKLWGIMCRLSYNEAPQFHLINASEAHHPFVCINHNEEINLDYIPYHYYQYPDLDYSGSIKQHDKAISYLDSTLQRIHSFFSPETLSIICSDHGAELGKGPIGHVFTCNEDTIHVPLIAHRSDFSHQIFPGLYSQKNIGSLIIGLMENGVVDPSIFSSYVVVERDPLYNKMYVENESIQRNAGDWLCAFKMVRDDKYKYILFENGNERLYKLPDEQTNIVGENYYKEILEELRGKINPTFPYNMQ